MNINIKIILVVALMPLSFLSCLSSAEDYPYEIQAPGTDAKIKFTSMYVLEQRGNTFYSVSGDAAIIFKFNVTEDAMHRWRNEINLLSASANHNTVTTKSDYNVGIGSFSYTNGVILIGDYTNRYGEVENLYMDIGMVQGDFLFKGKNITFTMEVIDLDGTRRTLQSLWISIPSTTKDSRLQLEELYRNLTTRAYDSAVKSKSNDTYAWNEIGYSFLELGEYEKAIQCFDQSIRLDPNSSSAWNNKGEALCKQEKYNESIQAYEMSIEIDPKFTKPWYNKGIVFAHQGYYDAAIQCFNESIRLNPNPAGMFYRTGRTTEYWSKQIVDTYRKFQNELIRKEHGVGVTEFLDDISQKKSINRSDAEFILSLSIDVTESLDSNDELNSTQKSETKNSINEILAWLYFNETSREILDDRMKSTILYRLRIGSVTAEAWQQKGLALEALGRINEAKAAFANAKTQGYRDRNSAN